MTFIDFCTQVRKDDSSILPEFGQPFSIRPLSEKENMELADALLENTNVTHLQLGTAQNQYTKSSAEAMAKYVRTSKRLQRVSWNGREMRQREEIFCCFLHAIQESTSLKELHLTFPLIGGPSNLAFENMLTHTQSLRSLSLSQIENVWVAEASSVFKNNTTLRELTLEYSLGAPIVSRILTNLRDHPLLRRLRVRGNGVDLTGLETLLLSDNSKITELEIDRKDRGPRMMGLKRVLQALARRPTLTTLGLLHCSLGPDEARELGIVLCTLSSLQSLVLAYNNLGSAGLAELAPALDHNTSIKVLDMSCNGLVGMESAEILRDVLRSNTTMTTLDFSGNEFEQTTGAVECIANGLGSNSTLLKIDLSKCALGDGGVSILAQTLGSRNTTLQKLTLKSNSITSTGVSVLLDSMEQSSHHITDLDLSFNPIGDEGASLLARSLGNNTLPNLTRLSVSHCKIGDDGFVALVTALEQNTSLLHLELRQTPHTWSRGRGFSERAFFVLAESLPEIKVLQRVDLTWCSGLGSAVPLLLAGLHKNTSLFRFYVTDCAPSSVPPTPEDTARCAGGWMEEMERVGYRNRFFSLIRAPKESLPPRGVWHRALARVATLHDVMFEVLRSKLVLSEDTKGNEALEATGKRRKCDE